MKTLAIKLTIIVFLIFGSYAANEWIEEKFNIPKSKDFWQKPVNNVHKWLSRLLFLAFIGFVILLSHQLKIDIGSFYVFYLLLAMEILRAIMEWKYEKQTKRYLLSISSSIVWVLILLVWFF